MCLEGKLYSFQLRGAGAEPLPVQGIPCSVQEGGVEPEVARWQRKGCGAHSTGKSQSSTLASHDPGLEADPEAGFLGFYHRWERRVQQAKGHWGRYSEAPECMTMAKVTLALVNLCFLNGKYLYI